MDKTKLYNILDEARFQMRCAARYGSERDSHINIAEGLLMAYEMLTGEKIDADAKAIQQEQNKICFHINLSNDRLIEKIADYADKASLAIDNDDDIEYEHYRKKCVSLLDVASYQNPVWYALLEDRVIDFRTYGSHDIG